MSGLFGGGGGGVTGTGADTGATWDDLTPATTGTTGGAANIDTGSFDPSGGTPGTNWQGVAKAVSQLQPTPQQAAAQAAANVPKATADKLAALTPVGRPAHPEAISNLLQFIASRRNAYIQAGQSPAGGVPQMPLPSGLLGI